MLKAFLSAQQTNEINRFTRSIRSEKEKLIFQWFLRLKFCVAFGYELSPASPFVFFFTSVECVRVMCVRKVGSVSGMGRG